MTRRAFAGFLAAAAYAQKPDRQRHVVLISLDGFAAYALRDPALAVPNIRALVRNGVAAEAMQVVNPSVTWPNHTTMVTGVAPARHGVLYNGLPVRAGDGKALRVEPWVDKTQLVQARTVYDAAHESGLTTAEIDWVAIHEAKTITWAFPERPRLTDPVAKELIDAGHIAADGISSFLKAPITYRDEIWTVAGEHILEKHKPNLLLFHLLTTDSAQHRYGARSLAGDAALALADAKVGRLVAALRRAGIYERTTVFVVADHGFKTYRKQIQPNAILRQKGLLRSTDDCDVWTIPEGGTSMVYITRASRKAELTASLPEMFRSVEGVARVIPPVEFASLGYPEPNERMADLVLAAADGYAFGGTIDGEAVVSVPAGSSPGAHGYLNTDPDMNAVLVASGAGIRKGATLGTVKNTALAPAIARLLGVALPDATDASLNSILLS